MPLDNHSTKTIAEQIVEKQRAVNLANDRLVVLVKDNGDPVDIDQATDHLETAQRELVPTPAHRKGQRRGRAANLRGWPHRQCAAGRRRRDDGKAITPDYLVKSAVVAIEASLFRRSIADVRKERYGDDDQRLLRAMSVTVPMLSKAAQAPATTFTARLCRRACSNILRRLARHDEGRSDLRADRVERRHASVTARWCSLPATTSPTYPNNLEAMWRKEGDPIRVGRMTTKAVEMIPYGPGVISHFTKELWARSTPNIEAVVQTGNCRRLGRGFRQSFVL